MAHFSGLRNVYKTTVKEEWRRFNYLGNSSQLAFELLGY